LQQGGQTCIHYDQAGHKHCQTLISDTIDSLLAGGDQLTDVSACNLAGGQLGGNTANLVETQPTWWKHSQLGGQLGGSTARCAQPDST